MPYCCAQLGDQGIRPQLPAMTSLARQEMVEQMLHGNASLRLKLGHVINNLVFHMQDGSFISRLINKAADDVKEAAPGTAGYDFRQDWTLASEEIFRGSSIKVVCPSSMQWLVCLTTTSCSSWPASPPGMLARVAGCFAALQADSSGCKHNPQHQPTSTARLAVKSCAVSRPQRAVMSKPSATAEFVQSYAGAGLSCSRLVTCCTCGCCCVVQEHLHTAVISAMEWYGDPRDRIKLARPGKPLNWASNAFEVAVHCRHTFEGHATAKLAYLNEQLPDFKPLDVYL